MWAVAGAALPQSSLEEVPETSVNATAGSLVAITPRVVVGRGHAHHYVLLLFSAFGMVSVIAAVFSFASWQRKQSTLATSTGGANASVSQDSPSALAAEAPAKASNLKLERSSKLPSHDRPRIFLAAFVLGWLNNNACATVVGIAQRMAHEFHQEDLVTVFMMFMLFAACVITLINGMVLVRFSVESRIRGLVLAQAIAWLALAQASTMPNNAGFALCLTACLVVGGCQVLGEVTCLSFLRTMPPGALGGWGAGTGFSGILGSMLFILLSGCGIPDAVTFLVMILSVFLYWLAFRYIHERLDPPVAAAHPSGNATLTAERLGTVLSTAGRVIAVLSAVYFFEYFIYPGMVDRDTICATKSFALGKYTFTLSWVAYSAGVMVSRASVAWVQIPHLSVLGALQAINCILWTCEAWTHTLRNALGSGGIIAWMTWIGLVGGATYGNCMHAFAALPSIPQDVRELAITVGFMGGNLAIVAATGAAGILDTTVLSSETLYPHGCPEA